MNSKDIESLMEEICRELAGDDYESLLQLLQILVDEERQVIHQANPNRIIQRISQHIDEHLEVN